MMFLRCFWPDYLGGGNWFSNDLYMINDMFNAPSKLTN